MSTFITITKKETERQEVFGYVQQKYRKRFGTLPCNAQIYICSLEAGQITGAIAMDFADSSGKLPLEYFYEINRAKSNFSLNSSQGAQIGRWIAEDSAVSSSLLYAASLYALKFGKEDAWFLHTEAVHRIVSRRGLLFYEIPTERMILENVPEGDQPFYTGSSSLKCYITPFRQAIQALQPQIDLFLNEGKIAFAPNLQV